MFNSPSQFAGMGFAASVLLLMLTLCFIVGHGLRPQWGLAWIAASAGISAARGFMDWVAPGTEITNTQGWLRGYVALSRTSLTTLTVGLHIYVGLAHREVDAVVVEVRDNGLGFDPAHAERLFQPFSRLHGRQFEGSGIGLTIVRRIVERHGGRVWAEGRPSEGASFFFRLPSAR